MSSTDPLSSLPPRSRIQQAVIQHGQLGIVVVLGLAGILLILAPGITAFLFPAAGPEETMSIDDFSGVPHVEGEPYAVQAELAWYGSLHEYDPGLATEVGADDDLFIAVLSDNADPNSCVTGFCMITLAGPDLEESGIYEIHYRNWNSSCDLLDGSRRANCFEQFAGYRITNYHDDLPLPLPEWSFYVSGLGILFISLVLLSIVLFANGDVVSEEGTVEEVIERPVEKPGTPRYTMPGAGRPLLSRD